MRMWAEYHQKVDAGRKQGRTELLRMVSQFEANWPNRETNPELFSAGPSRNS